MPEDLWTAAVSLCEERSIHRVSKRLRLGYDRLKMRVLEAELERARAVGAETECTQLEAAGFVEIPFDIPDRIAVTSLELSRADGAKMSFHLASDQGLDLARVSATFFGSIR